MKRIIKRTLVSFLIFVFSLMPISPQALLNFSQAIDVGGTIPTYKEWNESDNDINITENIVIPKGHTLVINEGVKVNFSKKYLNIIVEGTLEIKGTAEKPVELKSNFEKKEEGFYIGTQVGSTVNIKNAKISGGGSEAFLVKGFTSKALAANYKGALQVDGGTVSVEDSTFENNLYAVLVKDNLSGSVKVNYSKFKNNDFDVEDNNGSDFTNNYWDNLDESSDSDSDESCGMIKTVRRCLSKSYGNFLIYPWQEDENFVHGGGSSVLFLPGIESSRLYRKYSFGEVRLWEPANRNEGVKDLYMNSDGTSVDENIYTKDIVDEAYELNIYKGFMSYMDDLVEDEFIEEWKAVPYDWRLPIQNTLDDDGIRLADGESIDLLEEVQKLSESSNTGKVTIIGHSNGGLLGKALIDKLGSVGKTNLVDKFIMVAAPQAGTPKTVVGLLHGSELSLPFFLNEKTGRGLAENMSSAFNLLPSKKYFDYVQTPVVEFEEDVKDIYDFRGIYGDNIDNKDELDKFLTGDEGERIDPDFDDIDTPNVLSKNLLNNANAIHNNLLDSWQAPEGVEVIQIAGWGLDTIAGIKYDDCDIVFCPDKLSNLDRELIFKKDGDGTVVLPSAIIMDNEETYYVILKEYNSLGEFKRNRDHANILEISYLQEFIKNILNNKRDLPQYVTSVKPEVSDEDESLRYQMHSPVEVHLYDEENNHTGLTDNPNPESDLTYYEENISNSYYLEFGETKYLGSSKDDIRIELIGEDVGTFTFEIDKLKGESVDKTTIFKDIPVVKDMKAYLDVENIDIMKIDWNSDGNVDATIDLNKTNSNQVVSIQLLIEIIKSSKINSILKNIFLNELELAHRQMEKDKNKVAAKILEVIEKQIETFSDKKIMKKLRIDENEAENLIKIIETIRLNLIK